MPELRKNHESVGDHGMMGHALPCMPVYDVEWRMREAWRELMFAGTD